MGGVKDVTMKLPDTTKIKNKVRRFANSNFFVKTFIGLIIWGVALIPTYVFILIRWLIGPAGFWQELAVFLVCAVLFGWVQVITAILAVVLTFILIVEDV